MLIKLLNVLGAMLFVTLCSANMPFAMGQIRVREGFAAAKAAVPDCFIPQDKPCTQPDPANKLCSVQIIAPQITYTAYYENGLLIGYDPSVNYNGCDSLKEDVARDLTSVQDCTDVISKLPAANSRPGEQTSKPCFLRRECKVAAAVSNTRVGWAYYLDANMNDVNLPAPLPTFKAVCQSYAAAADPSAFDTIPFPLTWTPCILKNNCPR